MATEILDRVTERVEAQAKQRRAAFRTLAATIADGTEPTPEAVTETLAAAAKTVDDLRQQVDLVCRRRELRRTIDGEPALIARQAELRQAYAAADAELQAATDRHAATTGPIAFELDQVAAELQHVAAARRGLFDILDGGSKSKLERLRRQTETAQRQANEAKDQAEMLAGEAERRAAEQREALQGLGGLSDTHAKAPIARQAADRLEAAKAAAERSKRTADAAQQAADRLVAEFREAERAAID